jgi:hypothetical protein
LPGEGLPGARPGTTNPESNEACGAPVIPAMMAKGTATLSLSQEAERVGLSVDDRIKLDDQSLRRGMTIGLVWTFIVGDLFTLCALGWLVQLDQNNIEIDLIQPGDRLITSHVIMALLGATTVQIGTIAAIIARYLFPGRSRDEQVFGRDKVP